MVVGDRHRLDPSTDDLVTSTGAIYVEPSNPTDRPFRSYRADADRPRRIEFHQPCGPIGFRYTTH